MDNLLATNKNFMVHDLLWHRRGEWFLDVPRVAQTPWYDNYGMHNRSQNNLSIFDNPCCYFDSKRHSKYVIEFETFLVYKGEIIWRIHWERVKTSNSEEYENIQGMPAHSLAGTDLEHSQQWKIGYFHCYKFDEEHTVYFRALW